MANILCPVKSERTTKAENSTKDSKPSKRLVEVLLLLIII